MKKKNHIFLKLFIAVLVLALIAAVVYVVVKKVRDEEMKPLEEAADAARLFVAKINEVRAKIAA